MKTLSTLLSVSIVAVLSACGGESNPSTENGDDRATETDDDADAEERSGDDESAPHGDGAVSTGEDADRSLDSGSTRPPSTSRDASRGALDAGPTGTNDAAATASDAAGGTAPSVGGACDRRCLLEFMQKYYDALLAHDPTKVKISASVKYTENGTVAKLGEKLWMTASSLMPNARLDFADPMLGNVASMSVVQESGSTPVIYMARLKVANDEITEIEAMSVRRQGAANGFFNPANMVPQPVFLQMVAPEKRMTRDALNALTEQYLDYLEGKKRGNQLPFDAMCKRYENGQVTASGTSSFNSQSWRFSVTRRTLIIDEEAQITWGMYPFSQSANALVVGEAFKIIEGKFMMIQAVMANMPSKAWE